MDVGLDALGNNLDFFLHKTYLLVEFIGLESGIQNNWVCIKWTSIAQDIQVGMVEGQH